MAMLRGGRSGCYAPMLCGRPLQHHLRSPRRYSTPCCRAVGAANARSCSASPRALLLQIRRSHWTSALTMVKSVTRPRKSPRSAGSHQTSCAAPVEAIVSGSFEAPFGRLSIVASASGIRSISIDNRSPAVTTGIACRHGSIDAQSHVQQAQLQLREYFARQRTVFTLPLDARGTEFQTLAWSALCRIPFGSTSSYSQVPWARGHVCRVCTV